ncbi:MAG: DUF4912 domain-containing protein [Spirochaetota bacterium]
MHRHSLSDASFEALLRLADTYGADVAENVTRDELEESVAEAIDEWKAEHRQLNSHSVRVEETKYETQATGELDMPADEIELPESYNETRVVLMLRDPSWAYAYWDLAKADRARFERAEGFEGLLLRVFNMDEPDTPLAKARARFEIPVTLLDNRWYFNLPDQETLYRIVLVAVDDGKEEQLAASNTITVPRGMIAEDRGEERGEEPMNQILAQTGIQHLDVVTSGKQIPQRVLSLIDDESLFT